MVRIYCLSKISKIDPSENPVIVSSYNADELNDIERFISFSPDPSNLVQTTSYYLKEKCQNDTSSFCLTEISIGFLYTTQRTIYPGSNTVELKTKGYAMNVYRKDIEVMSFVLKRGSVIINPVSTYTFDFIVKTSAMYDDDIDFDILINVRCIRNTVIKGIINPNEEAYYEEYADKLVEKQIIEDSEPNFDDFKLPNETKLNVLRTKISDFKTLIELLCDPKTGSFRNVPMSKRYNQELKCLMYTRKLWKTKNFRKNEFEMQINNFRGCGTLRWEKVNFEKLTPDIKNVGSLKEIDLDACRIMNHKEEIFPNFNLLDFSCLETLNLQSCGLKAFSDNFADLLFPCLEKLNLEHNDLRHISNKISKFKLLKNLWIGNNRNLSDDGIPWSYLPESIYFLSLSKTNITKIPSEINKLKNLCILSADGKNLDHVSWEDISHTVQYLDIFKARNLNPIKLKDAKSMFDITIKNANLTDIDCSKLPLITAILNLEKNKLEKFDTKSTLLNLVELNLSDNKLKTVSWENLPIRLRKLTLNNNEFETIGDISHMDNLETLSMNSNLLTSLSVNAKNLRNLCLNSNQIEYIDPEILNLQNLRDLELTKNKISLLPNNFQILKIHTLNLSNNEFKYFDDTHTESLNERLWKRLPTNIDRLELDGNELYELPCMLENYKFCDLSVNNCKLAHICPCLFKKCRAEKFYQNLSIKNNPKLKHLPFIPQTIFQPPSAKDKSEENSNVATLKIITDNEDYINTSKFKYHMKKPVYEFKNFESVNSFGCLCCGICGNSSASHRMIEQIMVADYILAIVSNDSGNERIEDFLDSDGELKAQGTVGNCSVIMGLIYGEKIKERLHFCGEWKTNVATRICESCLKELEKKIDLAYEVFVQSSAKKDVIKRKKIKQVQVFEAEAFDPPQNHQHFYPGLIPTQNEMVENNEQNLQYLSLNPVQCPDDAYFDANQAFMMPVSEASVSLDPYLQQIQCQYYQPQYYQELPQQPYYVNQNDTFQQPLIPSFPNESYNHMQNEQQQALQPLPSIATLFTENNMNQDYYVSGHDHGSNETGFL